MKKQTLLALSAGLAITASGLTFANTQPNSFKSGSNETVISGYSDQTQGQQDQSASGQNQSENTTGNTLKKKIADSTCANGKCGSDKKGSNDSNSQNNSSDESTTQS